MTSPSILPPDATNLELCAQELLAGQLVVFPTETVYGLGADATNAEAITRIYETKNRPRFNPLIIHAASLEEAAQIGWIEGASLEIAEAVWPGPLTLVVPRLSSCPIPPLACAGLDSIALRVPSHPIATNLIKATGRPLAAPSANISGKISPTRAVHVATNLANATTIAGILEGGPSSFGIESTIIGFAPDDTPYLLRSGAIEQQQIETILGRSLVIPPNEPDKAARQAPGRLVRHYAPDTPLRLNADALGKDDVLLAFGPHPLSEDVPYLNLSPSGDVREAAMHLFDYLHTLDVIVKDRRVGDRRGEAKIEQDKSAASPVIVVMPIPHHGLGEAINDRLMRAATPYQD
ncbi:MAG: L-threonylcarbamoyladenylate synthase [Parvularculales bacterium]